MLKLSRKNVTSSAKSIATAALIITLVPLLGACKSIEENPYYPPKPSQAVLEEQWREDSQARVKTLNQEVSATADRDKLPHHVYQLGPVVTEPPAEADKPEDVSFPLPAGPLQDIEIQARYVGEGGVLLQIADSPTVTLVEGKGVPKPTLVNIPLQDDMAEKLVKVQTKAGSKGAWVVTLVCKKNTNPVCTQPAPTPDK